MSPKSSVVAILSFVLLGSSLGCADADQSEPAESLEQHSAALKPKYPPLSCTITGDFASRCRGRGGYSTCDDTTAMCCKTSKDENGNDSTFCSSNPDEVTAPPPSPTPTTAPFEPALSGVK